jgi:hypothetical protein
VNPITGCLDNPTAPNPFANMTEEQKEYEAVQLVNPVQFFLSVVDKSAPWSFKAV